MESNVFVEFEFVNNEYSANRTNLCKKNILHKSGENFKMKS